MGLAVDSVLAFNTQVGAGAFPLALAAAPGDSLTVRSFRDPSKAYLQSIITQSNAGGMKWRVASPLLHDNVTGLTFKPAENPAAFLGGRKFDIELNSQDTLALSGQTGAAYTASMVLVNYYENVRGASAELRRWEDISGMIKYVKAIEVSLSAIAVGAWTDTAITNTENQIHADYDYAVLGYTTDTALCAIGVKGEATGNLRICGPGVTSTLDITEYFVRMAELMQRPFIPVFNGNDRSAFYVSACNGAAIGGGAAEVTLIVAQLASRTL
jgi:hypothetical protein